MAPARRRMGMVGLVAAFGSAPVIAEAHLELVSPPGRYGRDVLKYWPCGQANGARTDRVSIFEAGATITVVFDEFVNHPGHYRVAFDVDGDDDFPDPECLSDCNSRRMVIETQPDAEWVLADGITDRDGGRYEVEVTLPNVTCDDCTLQVIQVMTDKPPYRVPGNDIYYQCADLELVAGTEDGGVGGDSAVARDAGGNRDAGVSSRDGGLAPDAGAAPPLAPDGGSDASLEQQAGSRPGPPSAELRGGCRAASDAGGWSGAVLLAASGTRRRRRRT